jgi:multidrug resistance efflux pump
MNALDRLRERHPRLATLVPGTLRVLVTLAAVAAGALAADRLWVHYQVEPWTRDGRVRADVVQVAPDVSGLVTDVPLGNDQTVRRGQVLFRIDRARYELALRQAEAAVRAQQATLAEARRENARNARLRDLVAAEVTEQGEARAQSTEAALAQAVAARDVARLNLERTTVLAPCDGLLSDLTLRVGDYVTAGKPVLALVDARSTRVEGYFEETKLARVRIGQRATVRIMGEPRVLEGRVASIAPAIEDRERGASANGLPNVNPTFSWVRLAQRVPVRIALDRVPDGVRLIAGRTATVSIVPDAPAAAAPATVAGLRP